MRELSIPQAASRSPFTARNFFTRPTLVECFLPTPNGFCFAIVYHNAFAQASTFAGGANAGACFLLSQPSRANARFSPRHPQCKGPEREDGALESQEQIGLVRIS